MKRINDNVKNYITFLFPIIIILMQGLYYNIQKSIAILLCIIIFRKMKISIKPFLFIFLIFTGLLISDIINGNNFNFLYEWLNISLLLLGIMCGKDRENALFGTYIAITFSSFVGIIAYLSGSSALDFVNTVDGTKVLQGVFGYANTMALFSGIGIILSAYYCGRDKDFKFIHECTLFLNAVAFLLTKSLFGCACLFVSVAFTLFIRSRKIRKYIYAFSLVAASFIIGLFVSGNEAFLLRPTVAARLIYWHDALLSLIKHPLGIGVHNWQAVQYAVQSSDYSVKYVHNGFIQLSLDGGIIALSGFILLIFYGCVYLIKGKCSTKNLYLLTIFIFILVHSFTDINFAYGAVWFIAGLILSFSNEKKADSGCTYVAYTLVSHNYARIFIPVLIIAATMAAVFPESEYVLSYKADYMAAYRAEDTVKMDIASSLWLKNCPRQQAAFDARYYTLSKLKDREGLLKLQSLKEKTNETMNILCKYLTRHKEIVLPGVK